MSQPAADRNLLFGVLALQMDFITREQLIAAMQAWVFDKSKSLGDILQAQKALPADSRQLLDALMVKHLAKHDNDPEKSLAAVSSVEGVKNDLASITDVDVQASLKHVARPKDHDIYATVAPSAISGSNVPSSAPSATFPSMSGLRFRILRPHARGGLGEVYVAHDEELHREVALKQIQGRAADDPESRSRFLLEAEITGGLEHPGIVPVYGLGTYGDGRPYYAMRFIRGDSLKEAVERFHKADAIGMSTGQRGLELRALLGRFVDVCNAIAYAHSRGILHRDLKPGNIMLGKYGETLVVDWGLAKPISEELQSTEMKTEVMGPGEGSLTPRSLSGTSQTLVGSALGTPQYMSPEQAAGRINELGPASDVYSLGATLYVILTGKASVNDTDVGTLLQKVMRGDIEKPRKLKPNTPPPLEAICLKAMALKPEDRYASPRFLADDIEHWLADEPVSAWPEPWTVKARRWIGRNRTKVSVGAASIVVALIGLIITAILLNAAKERETTAKLEAIENFKLARQAVDRYHTDVSESVLLNEPGMQPLRKKLLEAAKEFYEKFVKERANDPSVLADLGLATYRLAQITGDIDSEKKATELYADAIKDFDKLPAAEQASAEIRSDRATSWHHLGRLLRKTDQIPQSEEAYGKALAIWEQLTKDSPKDERAQAGLARTQLGLGNVYQINTKLDLAQKAYQQSLDNRVALANAHPKVPEYQRDLATSYNNLAIVLQRQPGKKADAEKAYRTALTLQKQLADDAPTISQYQNDLARTNLNLARLTAQGNPPPEKEYQEAVRIWQALVDRHPAVTEFNVNLGYAYTELARIYERTADLKKAAEVRQQALTMRRKLAEAHQGVPSYQGDVASSLVAVGDIAVKSGKLDQALPAYEEAARIQGKLVKDLPNVASYQVELAKGQEAIGSLYARDKKQAKAVEAYKQAIASWDRLVKDYANAPEYRPGLVRACLELGSLVGADGDAKDALVWYDRALAQATDDLKLMIRPQRALVMARGGKYVEAAAEAGALVGKAETGASFYRFAGIYALSAAAAAADKQQKLADEYAVEAVKVLAKADQIGFFKTPANRAKLQSDPDLQALRARADFKKLSEMK